MKLGDIQTLVQIINSVVVTLGILGGGLFSFYSRFFAGTIQISLTLISVNRVNNTRIAIVGVRVKNIGRSRIKKDSCLFVAQASKVLSVAQAGKAQSLSEPIEIITPEPINFSEAREIFLALKEIEPNGETYEEVALSRLAEGARFWLSVRFYQKGLKRTRRSWESNTVFNADDKA